MWILRKLESIINPDFQLRFIDDVEISFSDYHLAMSQKVSAKAEEKMDDKFSASVEINQLSFFYSLQRNVSRLLFVS